MSSGAHSRKLHFFHVTSEVARVFQPVRCSFVVVIEAPVSHETPSIFSAHFVECTSNPLQGCHVFTISRANPVGIDAFQFRTTRRSRAHKGSLCLSCSTLESARHFSNLLTCSSCCFVAQLDCLPQ